MNGLRLLDPSLKDPFESVFRGFLAPMRFDLKPGTSSKPLAIN